MAVQTLNQGVQGRSFNLSVAAVGNGQDYGLPTQDIQTITWQTGFGTAPASVTILIQISLDGTAWFTGATSTTVTGEIGSFSTSALFIRARISAISGGANVTVIIVSKNGDASTSGGGTGDATAANQTTQIALAATSDASLTSIAASSSVLDDWDETNRAAVNIIAGQVGVVGGAGASSALTIRTVTASNSPDVTSLEIIDDWDESDRAKVNPIAGQAGIAAGSGASSALTTRVVLATDTTVPNVTGNVAHDGADSGNPLKIGNKAVNWGVTPTPVAASDRTDWYADRYGFPFINPAPPDLLTFVANYSAAQTNVAIISVSAGSRLVVYQASIITSGDCTVNVAAYVGFGTATTPGSVGVYISHPGIPPGFGVSTPMIPVSGADNEDFRITCDDPSGGGGSIEVTVKYRVVSAS